MTAASDGHAAENRKPQVGGAIRMDLNQLVEIAPGVTKPLGNCTDADLTAASELIMAKGIRNGAAAERLAAGLPPACDWRYADGTYCVNDSVFIRTNGNDPDVPRSLCREHAPR